MPQLQLPSGSRGASLPAVAGCYALVLRVERATSVTVGALGALTLLPGSHIYCGSAQGRGGLRARVGRHLRGGGRLRWHVDYLRQVAEVEGVWLWPGAPRAFECTAAAAFAALSGASRPVPHFGSSDCRCAGHLIALP